MHYVQLFFGLWIVWFIVFTFAHMLRFPIRAASYTIVAGLVFGFIAAAGSFLALKGFGL